MSTDTTGGVLDSIDGALRDFETGRDAMRWVPPALRTTPAVPALPAPWYPLDGAQFRAEAPAGLADALAAAARALGEIAREVWEALKAFAAGAGKTVHGLHLALYPKQHQRCTTCHPWRKPKPLAVNGREYQRRLRARRRRNRKGTVAA